MCSSDVKGFPSCRDVSQTVRSAALCAVCVELTELRCVSSRGYGLEGRGSERDASLGLWWCGGVPGAGGLKLDPVR